MSWQAAAVVFPDIEMELTGRYRTALATRAESYAQGVYVANTRPGSDAWREAHPGGEPYPARMVIVRRDGGTQGEMRDQPRVTINVWAKSEADATNLASLVMGLAPSFADGDPIVAVPTLGRSGPFPVADGSAQPLRSMSIEFHTRGVPA